MRRLRNAVIGLSVAFVAGAAGASGEVVEDRWVGSEWLCVRGVRAELDGMGKEWTERTVPAGTVFRTDADPGDPRGDTVLLECFGSRLRVTLQS